MIGYHYTSFSHWKHIQKEGLKTRKIDLPELIIHFDIPIYGIWLWKKRFSGIKNLGNVVWTLSRYSDTQIVLLEVKYDEKYILQHHEYSDLVLTHKGYVNDFVYAPEEKSVIITKNIPPKDIQLIKKYDLLQLIR